MHIADGFLSPATCVGCYAVMVPAWVAASKRLGTTEGTRALSRVGLAAAFSFALMMFNVPVPGGTTGHAVGTSLIAIVLGPSAAILAVSATLLIQALMFGDGGITTFAANCLGMAVLPAVGAWALWRSIGATGGSMRRVIVAGLAGYVPVLLGSLVMAVLLGMQPAIARDATGDPKYFPFGLGVTVAAIGIAHLVIGLIEGAVTAGAVAAMARMPEFSGVFRTSDGPVVRPWRRHRGVWTAALLLSLAVPAGLLLPEWAGAGEPWGEWGPQEVAHRAGMHKVPQGMGKLAESWRSPVPDYAFSEVASVPAATGQYVGAGLLGILLIALCFLGVQKMLLFKGNLRR